MSRAPQVVYTITNDKTGEYRVVDNFEAMKFFNCDTYQFYRIVQLGGKGIFSIKREATKSPKEFPLEFQVRFSHEWDEAVARLRRV